MTTLTADQALCDIFAALKEKAEVLDAEGTAIGYLTPREVEEELLYEYAAKAFDAGEIKRQLNEEKTGAPLEEVLERIRRSEN